MGPIELVIFDCDGVLVDSEPLAMRVLLRIIAEQGIEVDRGTAFRSFLGRSLASISESLNQSHGSGLNEASLAGMREQLFALYRRELAATPFVANAIDGLGLPFCVASSSQVERIRLSLELTGMLERFEGRIYSASMVNNGKPAPDLFLHAARQMGVLPENCLVIEDSPAGIIAARAAGMRVFAYTGGGHIAESGLLPEIEALAPDAIMDDMRALSGLVAYHGGRDHQATPLLVAVDVGTASTRAGVVTASGHIIGRAERTIELLRSDANHAQYDSEQIWTATTEAVRAAMALAGARAPDVVGISFDATCSLVVRNAAGAPLSVGPVDEPRWDTIAWLDHRALGEAEECTETGHQVLDFVGGVMSPEMEIPKLMWLKRHRPDTWREAGLIFDLADFLTWKASGSTSRSQCTLTCKWTYLAHEVPGWRRDFLDTVGMGDLLERSGLPESASPVGRSLGPLTAVAAASLGLTQACQVGVGLIDAHAGALGSLASFAQEPGDLHRHLALIAGTSSCVMALSQLPRPAQGVWGPYLGAVFPGVWLNEAGQSATGALLDHILRWHRAGGDPTAARHLQVVARIRELRELEGVSLGARLHVLPDFHGNRSPLANPEALGVLSGLSLDSDFDSLCRLYWRAAVAIAVQVRHILEALRSQGFAVDTLHVAGGHSRNPLLMELYANATGCTVVELATQDATLLGVAMAAATAAGLYPDLPDACVAMARPGIARQPDPASADQFERDYRAQQAMQRHRAELDAITGDRA